MNIPNTKTIIKIVSKEVNSKSHLQERIHVSEILWIEADSTKLQPMLVFKGQLNDRVEKRLDKNSLVKDKTVFTYCQPRNGII